jgi:hypothetical protein
MTPLDEREGERERESARDRREIHFSSPTQFDDEIERERARQTRILSLVADDR